jgi:hypothetical protein
VWPAQQKPELLQPVGRVRISRSAAAIGCALPQSSSYWVEPHEIESSFESSFSKFDSGDFSSLSESTIRKFEKAVKPTIVARLPRIFGAYSSRIPVANGEQMHMAFVYRLFACQHLITIAYT